MKSTQLSFNLQRYARGVCAAISLILLLSLPVLGQDKPADPVRHPCQTEHQLTHSLPFNQNCDWREMVVKKSDCVAYKLHYGLICEETQTPKRKPRFFNKKPVHGRHFLTATPVHRRFGNSELAGVEPATPAHQETFGLPANQNCRNLAEHQAKQRKAEKRKPRRVRKARR